MQDILKHFLPNTDLTPEKLRALALECNKADASPAAVPASTASLSPFVPYKLLSIPDEDTILHDHIQEDLCPDPKVESEDAIFRDVFQLQQQFGCLLADSQGEYSMSSVVRKLKK
jgi:threonyl-tRNA synthetase